MRGKLHSSLTPSERQRITPAGAGKTIITGSSTSISPGSPPQVRGKHGGKNHPRIDNGITPAGAGKTMVQAAAAYSAGDHPRRCGENMLLFGLCMHERGSPPQVRGKHIGKIGNTFALRITPAGAGKTVATATAHDNEWDHPRRCGENSRRLTVSRLSSGSPPQVRGKL